MATEQTSNLGDISRKTAQFKHPLMLQFSDIWRKLADVREGIGGFLDGTYIHAHPREWIDHSAEVPQRPTKKLKERRRIARYENFGGSLIKQLKAALFRDEPTRRLNKYEGQADRDPAPIEEWWDNVDGKTQPTKILDYYAFLWDAAATFGHVLVYMDRASQQGETAADIAQPILRAYTPLDIADWELDDVGNLLWVKLIEPPPARTDPTVAADTSSKYRVRIVDGTSWALYEHSGKLIDKAEHHMGTVPCVLLYSERRPLVPLIGQSVLGDPNLHIDLYNLVSENRELFRKQAFSILNIPLGTGPDAMDVEKAKSLLNQEVSTEGVVFSGAAAGFISAEAANLTAYLQERMYLVRTIFRLAGVFWESDSKDAEAEGSLKLKREDMNQRLAAYADELEQTDVAICRLWYRATYGADAWERHWEEDDLYIQWPQNFDVTPFEMILEQAEAAMSLGMPPPVQKALQKRLLPKFLQDMGPKEKAELEAAINSAEDAVTPQEEKRAQLENDAAVAKAKAKPKAA